MKIKAHLLLVAVLFLGASACVEKKSTDPKCETPAAKQTQSAALAGFSAEEAAVLCPLASQVKFQPNPDAEQKGWGNILGTQRGINFQNVAEEGGMYVASPADLNTSGHSISFEAGDAKTGILGTQRGRTLLCYYHYTTQGGTVQSVTLAGMLGGGC